MLLKLSRMQLDVLCYSVDGSKAIRLVGKKIVFLILRDRLSTVQCVLVRGDNALAKDQMLSFARDLPRESFVEVGLVSLPIKPINYTMQHI